MRNNGFFVFISCLNWLLDVFGVLFVIPPSGVWYWLSVIILYIISHKEQIRITCKLLGIIPNIVAFFQRMKRKFKQTKTNRPKELSNISELPSSTINKIKNNVSNDNNTDCEINNYYLNKCCINIIKNDDNK
jgi:hypothetical protein